MTYVIEGQGALVNAKGEEIPLKAGDFAIQDMNSLGLLFNFSFHADAFV